MEQMPLEGNIREKVVKALSASTLFTKVDPKLLYQVAQTAQLCRATPGEVIFNQGDPSDSFFVIMNGEVGVFGRHEQSGDLIELARLGANETFGELGLLLGQTRSATIKSIAQPVLLRFTEKIFDTLFDQLIGFGQAICRALADRLHHTSSQILRSSVDMSEEGPDEETLQLLPLPFQQRHRVLPLARKGRTITLGFVDSPTPEILGIANHMLSGLEIRTARIDASDFDQILRHRSGASGWSASEASTESKEGGFDPTAATQTLGSGADPRLDVLLRRQLEEGASDLHLSGGQRPRWCVDGSINELSDTSVLGATEVYDLLRPAMQAAHVEEFEETNDCDFSMALPGMARFRVNLFRDAGGIGAVLRVIPAKILSLEQLGLPEAAHNLLNHPKGMILVTGPTGSGKSTTLAAMIDKINRNTDGHIITLEDPIEFVHSSRKCLVNQREVGSHTVSFTKALRAALREDPDIILVGEMRDLETVSLALETANTGHLVFGTLHTTTAIGTIDRIVEMFPHEEQTLVKAVLAESLRGVVSQTLCKRIGGGRAGAYEILIVNHGVSNLIREGKPNQIINLMQTGKKQGNQMLNEALCNLVTEGVVEADEALAKTVDKADLQKRLNA
jgi:twitching motility protein PilT